MDVAVIEEWEESELSLLETLDHVLNRGLVIAGEIVATWLGHRGVCAGQTFELVALDGLGEVV